MCGILCTNTAVSGDALLPYLQHRGTYPPRTTSIHGFTWIHTLMPVQGGEPVFQPYGSLDPHILLFQGELWRHPGFDSDTEYLYAQLVRSRDMWATVNGLEGMFAFVYSDGGGIWFASDIFGEQPLYYCHGGGGGFFHPLTVATEAKQLRACGVPMGKAKPCLPGHLYHYDLATGNLTVTVYHSFDYSQARTPRVDHRRVREMLVASCAAKYNAVSLQRVALLLSGGVDSTIIAFELAKLGLRRAFTVASDPDSTDFQTASVTAAAYGLDHTKVLCKTLDPDLSIAMGESKNRSVVEEYVCHLALARCLADQGYRVVLTGSGADELFVGYPYYLRFYNKGNRSGLQEKLVEGYHSRELRVLNKVYMSRAVEVRSPFLDRALADYACTLDVDKCLVDGGRMKAALRDAYATDIPSAKNPKVIAGRTMGVIGHFAKQNGGMDPRVYHERYKAIFGDNALLLNLLGSMDAVQYEILP